MRRRVVIWAWPSPAGASWRACRIRPSKSPGPTSSPFLIRSYSCSSTSRAISQAPVLPVRITTLPWACASMPSRSSISARCASYSPSSLGRNRLSSKGTTTRFLACCGLGGRFGPGSDGPRNAVKFDSPGRSLDDSQHAKLLAHAGACLHHNVPRVGRNGKRSFQVGHTTPDRLLGPAARISTAQNAPDMFLVRHGMDRLQVGRTPDQLTVMAAWLLEQHWQHPSHTPSVEGVLLALQQVLQAGQPRRGHRLRQLASPCSPPASPDAALNLNE